MKYTEIELENLHRVNFNMAKYFVEFCTKYSLLCYFCGGGCIGTVRNQGFVPWDDDLDFFMPREDYEKLYDLWVKNTSNDRYVICKPSATYYDGNQFVTIRDSQTTMIKPYQRELDIVHGVSLDIFPLDGYPNKDKDRKKQVIWAYINSLFCTQQIPQKHGKLMTMGAKVLFFLIPTRGLRYKISKYAEKHMSKYKIENCYYITELCAGPGYMKKKYPKEIFESAIFGEFEDTKMPIPVGYDIYLRIAFGDYMQLPALEKRVAHHDCVVLDLKNSYKKYKDIYYCVKRKK